jgi:hypothetical protein
MKASLTPGQKQSTQRLGRNLTTDRNVDATNRAKPCKHRIFPVYAASQIGGSVGHTSSELTSADARSGGGTVA